DWTPRLCCCSDEQVNKEPPFWLRDIGGKQLFKLVYYQYHLCPGLLHKGQAEPMQTKFPISLERLSYNLDAFVWKACGQQARQGFHRLLSGDHRVQVQPGCAPCNSVVPQPGQEPGHHDTRFAGPTGSKNCQQAWSGLCGRGDLAHLVELREQFLYERVSAKEIGSVL